MFVKKAALHEAAVSFTAAGGAPPPVRMTLLLPQSHVLEVVPGDDFLAHEVPRLHGRNSCPPGPKVFSYLQKGGGPKI